MVSFCVLCISLTGVFRGVQENASLFTFKAQLLTKLQETTLKSNYSGQRQRQENAVSVAAWRDGTAQERAQAEVQADSTKEGVGWVWVVSTVWIGMFF